MSIIIYTSRQSAGRNAARQKLIDRIIFTYKETPFYDRNKILVITPKQNTYQIERELIEKIGEGGLFGIQVMDFHTLLKRIVKEEGVGFDIVDEHGRLMLMQKSLTDIKPDLKIYASSVEKQGFAEQVVDQISDLKRASISSEMLLDQVDNLEGTLLSDKMYDLGMIFDQFNKNLGEDRLDEDDLLLKALSLVKDSSLIKNAQIFFLDYEIIDRNQADFLVQASESAQTLEIALIDDSNPNIYDATAFMAVNESISYLRYLAAENGVKLIVHYEDNPKTAQTSLNFLSDQLFSFNPIPYSLSDSFVTLYNEKDPWEEISRIAQLIAMESEKGVDYSRIAVIMPNPETYESIIRKVFQQYHIPIFIDDNHRVTDNHFIQSVLAALDTVASEFNRAEILNYIKSDFSGLSSNEADLLENYVIEAGIRPWEWQKRFKRIPVNWRLEEKNLEKDHPINEIRKRLVKNLKVLRPDKGQKTYSEFIQNLKDYLETTKAQDRLIELSDQMSLYGEQELSLRYRQVWNILMELLDQMEVTLGPIPTSFDEFITVLKTGLSSYEIGVIPEDQEAVLIGNLDRTKLPEIDSLYFVGLNEGLLPRSYSDTSLFSEHDKERLSEIFNLEQGQIKSRQFLHKLEELNLYSLVTKPIERITFSYSTFDNDGYSLLPSRYVSILDQIYPNNLRKEKPALFPILTPERAEVILESLKEDETVLKIRNIINEWRKENDHEEFRFIKPDLLRAQGEDYLVSSNAIDLYTKPGEHLKVSPSRLEEFASCPFKHFVDYGLRPQEREEYEVRALDTGIVVHEVFDQFIKALHDQSKNDPKRYHELIDEYLKENKRLEKECDQIFDKVLENVQNSNRYSHTGASRYLLVKIKRIIYTSLLMMLQQLSQTDYVPFQMEQSFYEETDSGVVITGRIDRIDVMDKEEEAKPIRVIDYKTGNKEVTYTDLYYGRALQLALYLSEAVKYLDKTTNDEFKPGGAFYFLTNKNSLSDIRPEKILEELEKNYRMDGFFNKDEFKDYQDIKKGNKNTIKKPYNLSDEELDKLLKHTDKVVEKLTTALTKGTISMNPSYINDLDNGCRYCAFKDICRYNNQTNPKRKLQDLNKEQFFELISEEIDE